MSTRLGRFEFAEGGTLFLDEIGDMSLQMQVKLLRVLQERTFERVGSNKTLRCNVRIIAATHRDLDAAIGAGRFREDLFYRLNVFPIQMPALRERLEDLPVLIEHLVQRQGQIAGRHVRLDQSALQALASYPWPGNVRELSNLLERLAILFPERGVGAGDLPERYRHHVAPAWTGDGDGNGNGIRIAMPATAALPCVANVDADVSDEAAEGSSQHRESCVPFAALPRGGLDLKDHLSAIEIGLIRQALEEGDGTVAGAARLLKIRRTTLVEKLRKYRMSA